MMYSLYDNVYVIWSEWYRLYDIDHEIWAIHRVYENSPKKSELSSLPHFLPFGCTFAAALLKRSSIGTDSVNESSSP